MDNKSLDIINILDIVLLILFVRILYVGVRRGPLIEIFKLAGVFCSTFICLHYYLRFGKLLSKFIALPQGGVDALAFFLLWALVSMAFKLLMEGCLVLFGKRDEENSAQPLLTFLLALVRGVLVGGLLFAGIVCSGNPFLARVASQSYSGMIVKQAPVAIYNRLYKTVIVTLFPSEEINEKALQLDKPEDFIK